MEKCTVTQVLAAIKNSGGIKTNIARKLDVSRFTIDNYEKKYPSIEKAIKEERDKIKDKAESNIFVKIQDGDLGVSQWYLRYKGGYIEKVGIDAKVVSKATKKVTIKIPDKMVKKIAEEMAKEDVGREEMH